MADNDNEEHNPFIDIQNLDEVKATEVGLLGRMFSMTDNANTNYEVNRIRGVIYAYQLDKLKQFNKLNGFNYDPDEYMRKMQSALGDARSNHIMYMRTFEDAGYIFYYVDSNYRANKSHLKLILGERLIKATMDDVEYMRDIFFTPII